MHNKSYYENLWNTIKSGQTWEGEFCNQDKYGNTYWEQVVISPIKNEQKQIINFVAIKTDISELKKVTKELVKAKEQAEESDRLKSAFLRNISHEIRTPMNAIMGFSDLLQKQTLSEEKRKQFSEIVYKSINQLLKIVENTITIAHIETNQLQIKEIEFSPNALIQEIKSEYILFQKKTEKQNISLVAITNYYSEIKINSDYTRLQQIFRILIDNSFKFTESGKIEFGYNQKNNEIEFFVKDTGIGIPIEKQQIIFKSFAHADDKITQLFGGIGLGLSIAVGLIKLLKGELIIKSNENIGTEIKFSLPVIPKSHVKIDNPKQSIETKKTLLVAEDEEFNFIYIEELLINTGLKLIHAENGKIAVDIFKNQDVDLILMDIKMPELDGFGATQEIRKIDKKVPIIAQTAFSYKREDCINAGFTDYIAKPFDEEQLINKIGQYIEIQTNSRVGKGELHP